MDSSNSLTFRIRPEPEKKAGPTVTDQTLQTDDRQSRCPSLAAFLAICFSNEGERLGLHPVLTNTAPNLDDVSLRGGSFDVRKVKSSSFPLQLADDLFRGRDFVVVKHPRPNSHDADRPEVFSEIAMELQVLRHSPIRSHANVIDLLAVMYHDAGDAKRPVILPALVLEYAAFGSLKTFQEEGHGHSFEDKINIALDVARGIEALHACGIVHGDVKTSNMLVCKHAIREFIVKVSDFGFSLVIGDLQLLGHTEIYCPPESYQGQLDPEHAKKVDIYCYGLLLHSVLKEGTAYYPQGPDAPVGSSDDFQKMKLSGLMPSTLVLNLLITGPGREPYPLLLLSKILLYCLLPEPKQRIHAMSSIIFYLGLLESSCGGTSGPQSDKSVSEKVTAMLETATEARKGAASGGASLLTSLTTVIRAMMGTLEGQILSPGSDQTRQFLAVVSTFTETVLNNFITTAAKLEIPMFEVISTRLRSRAQKQLSQIAGEGPDSNQPSFSVARLCQLLLDCVGLFPETGALELTPGDSAQTFSSPQLCLCQGYDLIPDFSLLHGVFQKMPWSVQKAAVQSLVQLHETTTDAVAKRKAALSLASVYANGIGVEFELSEASRLVLEAAKLGDEKAQTVYINAFCSDDPLQPHGVDEYSWRSWLSKSAEAGNDIALCRLRILDPAAISAISKARHQVEYAIANVNLAGVGGLCANITNNTSSDQLKAIFLSAVIEDNKCVVKHCLGLNQDLLVSRFDNGEHALLMACRLGSFQVAKALVSTRNANLGDEQGARPLHWLSRSSGEQHTIMAKLLIDNGADVDAIGPALHRSDNEQRVQRGRLRWTPLHWAVAFDSPSAVHALLDLGCDPSLRAEPDRGTWDLSALELASSLCNIAALSALLTNEAVRSEVNRARPMVQGMAVFITPLFYVLGSRSRWERMRQHGMRSEQKTYETLSLLIENGAKTDRVLQSHDAKMPAVFATAYHSCCADVMASGLKLGFANEIDSTYGSLSSGGSALFLAITHRDRAMFEALVEAGASLSCRDKDGMTPLHRAAKENDDVFFTRALLDAGVAVDPEPNSSLPSPFQVAVYCRNSNVAKLLFDSGADRDRIGPQHHRTILGDMLFMHTWNSLERVKFLLELPDRPGGESDGFIAARLDDEKISVFHLAASYTSEATSQRPDITAIMVTQLLRKYNEKKHVNSTCGPFSMTALAVAVENGDYGVVRKLLEAGADPNVADKFGRAPLDLLYRRYCFPENLPTFDEVDHDDTLAIGRALQSINENTAEVLSLLTSYGAEANTFRFPIWHQADPSYRNATWVLERLKEKKEKKPESKIGS